MIEVVRDSNLIRRLRSSVAWPEKRSESTRFEAWVNPHFGTWRQLVKKKEKKGTTAFKYAVQRQEKKWIYRAESLDRASIFWLSFGSARLNQKSRT